MLAKIVVFLALMPFAAHPGAYSQDTSSTPLALPRFEDYPVVDTLERHPALPDVRTTMLGRRFRTVLRAGAKAGPNFAGLYTVVTWGCGSSCQMNAIVDARTGRVYTQVLQSMVGLSYQRNSALIIVDPAEHAEDIFGGPPPDKCAVCGTPSAFVWKGDHFEPVGSGDHEALIETK